MTTLPLASAYRPAITLALFLQLLATLLLRSLLDGGALARIGAAAMIGFWIGVAFVLFRRPRNPTSLDLLYVRWGYLAMLTIAIACMPFMGALRSH